MGKVTVIVIAYNELDNVKYCLEAINKYGSEEIENVIVVDNGSQDGTTEWLDEQEGLTYVYFDEGKQTYASLLNRVVEELHITNDMLIIQASYLLTPYCIRKMQHIIDKEERIAVVGGMSNGFMPPQDIPNLQQYKTAVLAAEELEREEEYETGLGVGEGAYLLKYEAYKKIGCFDEKLYTIQKAVEDYMLRLVEKDFLIARALSAIVFDTKAGKYNDPFENMKEIDLRYMYKKWGMHYFNRAYNENLIQFIKSNNTDKIRVLEIGCDCGATLLEIKNRFKNAEIFGVELNPRAAEIASHVANVEVGNIENEELIYEKGIFDYIIFGDVLEHLRNPVRTLQYCRMFLKEHGYIIASIPNLMHITVIWPLLNGDFTYTETGLLDKTHIHLFTYNEILKMFAEADYQVETVGNVVLTLNEEWNNYIDSVMSVSVKAERFMYETYQYIVRAVK